MSELIVPQAVADARAAAARKLPSSAHGSPTPPKAPPAPAPEKPWSVRKHLLQLAPRKADIDAKAAYDARQADIERQKQGLAEVLQRSFKNNLTPQSIAETFIQSGVAKAPIRNPMY